MSLDKNLRTIFCGISIFGVRNGERHVMATIKPFRAIRPEKSLASKIAALPYDVYSSDEARKIVERNPYSFLKIDRAETQLPRGVDIYAPEVYRKAAGTLQEMFEKGEFLIENQDCFYVYELTMNGRTQTGIGACALVREYEEKIIKKHENTRKDKEDDRTRHITVCNAQTGPIFLAYRYHDAIHQRTMAVKESSPEYDFIADDGVRHRMWVISDTDTIMELEALFQEVPVLYIADGHHRAASAVRVAEERRRKEKHGKTGEPFPPYELFLSVLFADSELLIMDYNRWVMDLNGKTKKDFLIEVQKNFAVCPLETAQHPSEKGMFTMYLDHQWYQLRTLHTDHLHDVVDLLDVSLLQERVLRPILGIENPKTDRRIQFIGGVRGLQELEHMVDREGGVAFALYPTSITELFAVADEDRLMPPKSTWFEPKLRSGLLIHQI